MALKLNCQYLSDFVSDKEIAALQDEVNKAHAFLYENKANAEGKDFHGWLTLPEDYDREEFARIKAAAERIKSDSQVLLVIGIGGFLFR